jgi:hypothetical protein
MQRVAFLAADRCISVEHDGVLRMFSIAPASSPFEPALALQATHRLFDVGTWMPGLALLSEREAIVAAWNRGVARVRLDTGALVTTYPRELETFTGGLALTADRALVAFATHGLIEVFTVDEPRRVARLEVPCEVTRLAFSSRGTLAVAGDANGAGWLGLFELTRVE